MKYIVLALIAFVAAKMYKENHRKNYTGPYNDDGSYDSITPMKHDLFKQSTLDVIPLLIFGLASGDKLFDSNDFLNSVAGKISVGLLSYVVYYQIVEPYIAAKIQKF